MSNQQTTNDLFIHTPADHAAHNATLTERYNAVRSSFTTMQELYAAYKKACGQRVTYDLNGPNSGRYLQRERACAVAYLRAALASRALFCLLQPLMDTINQLRQECDTQEKYGEERDIRWNNLAAGEELFEESCALCFEFRLIYCGDVGAFSIREFYNKRPSLDRHFVIKCGVSCSSYRFDGLDPDSPPPAPYMTAAEAKVHASYAEGIGTGVSAIVCDLIVRAAHLESMEVLRNTEPTDEQGRVIADCLTRARIDIVALHRKNLSAEERQRYAYCGSIRVQRQRGNELIIDRLVILHVAKKLQEEGIAVIDFTVHGSHEYDLYVPHKDA